MSVAGQQFETDLRALRDRVNLRLAQYVGPQADCPETLRESMAYSLLAGGKRLRPILVLLTCEACGGKIEQSLPAACAIEMVHTYSLIHDDLPAMDDDDYRRGRLTNHKVFGEAMAILAGDALLTLALEVVARDIQPGAVAAACCADLASAAGWCGMVGGQVADLEAEQKLEKCSSDQIRMNGSAGGAAGGKNQGDMAGANSEAAKNQGNVAGANSEGAKNQGADTPRSPFEGCSSPATVALSQLEAIHRRKTGRLLCSAVTLGARIAQAETSLVNRLEEFGKHVGLAFQIADDLLDVTGDATKLGKNVGKDATLGKMTYPALLGIEGSRQKADDLIREACRLLEPLGERASPLAELARFVTKRDH